MASPAEQHRPVPPGHSKADLHIHTTFSDGTLEPEDLLNDDSVVPDLRVIAITDHDTIDGALRVVDHRRKHLDVYAGIDVIVGEEITAREGHVIGLFLEEWVPPDLSAAETIERIHAQGGLAIAAHPYTHLLPFTGLRGVGDLIHTLPFDAVEVRNANFSEVVANRIAARRSRGMAQVGSSDAHFLRAVGRCYTVFPGSTAADLRAAIESRATRAEGACYGLPTLWGYVVDQLRAGRSLLPDRQRARHAPVGSDLRIEAVAAREQDAIWLICSGRLDARASLAIKHRAQRTLEAGMHLVLDLGGIEWLDSAGITALIAGYKCSRRVNRLFLIADPAPIVERSLRLAGLHEALELVRDDEEVWRAIRVHQRTGQLGREIDLGPRTATGGTGGAEPESQREAASETAAAEGAAAAEGEETAGRKAAAGGATPRGAARTSRHRAA
jgi:anti-anti-sigma factor